MDDDLRHGTFDPDAIFRTLENAAEAWLSAKETADNLTELKKTMLARYTLDAMKSSKSRIEAEMVALADPAYEEYLRGMNAAERVANRAKAKFDNMKILSELRRSEESSRRSLSR